MEKFTDNTRFCLICNYLSKIIPALQSRCTRFRFGPLSAEQIMPRLEYVIAKEGVKATEEGKKALIELADGDMRRVINVLQSTAMAFEEVDENNVYACCGQPLKSDIEEILSWLLTTDISFIYKRKQTYLLVRTKDVPVVTNPSSFSLSGMAALQAQKGFALQDLVTRIHPFIHKSASLFKD